MNVGVFLSMGESFRDLKTKGQDTLVRDYLLKNYSRNFDTVYVFSYENESFTYFGNVKILPNKWRTHRFFYSIFLPFFYPRIIASCDILRGLQLTGGIPGLLSKLFFRKKFVFNYGYFYEQFAFLEGKRLQSFMYRLIKFPILYFSDSVIVTTDYLRKYLIQFIPEEKITIIHNGVDTSLFLKKNAKRRYTCIYVGRFEKQKNLHALILAVSQLKNKYVSLLFIGSGSQKKELENSAKRYGVNLTILDSITHTKLPFYLNQSSLFILPSLIEGQPKALLEAMSCELPVIASDIFAHREIITHKKNGILSGTKPEEIAKVLESILKDKPMQEMLAKNARKTILEKYTMTQLNKKEIVLLKCLSE